MNKKRTKKILAILMLIAILATDFFVLGSNLITYAAQVNSKTDNDNIEFSVYFKDGENKVDSTQTSIKNKDLRLYAEIKVNKEGYIKEGATIKIDNSNFNLKEEILESNTHIASIEGNIVNLKLVDNIKPVEIELAIEPIIAENMTTDFLSKTSTVMMNGTYIYSQEETGESISTTRQVCVDYQPDKATKAELETEIITNKEYSINETNQRQRIVQVLVKSRLTNNDYPVKQTILNVGIPQLGENAPEVKVLATGKLATNGATEISTENWTVENGTLKITINNDADSKINWSKNVYDEAIVTYIYTETANENVETTANTLEITTNSSIKVHNSENTYTATQTKGITNQELSNVIIGKTEITTEEMYKGKIKSNIDQEYNTKTSIIVPNANIVDERVVKEGKDAFGADNGELEANTKYITTELNLEKTLNILGEDGSLQIVPIKNGEKIVEKATEINKGTVVNENGNVIITYEDLVDEIEIITTKPTTIGIIELNHTKVITGNNYTKAQLQEVKTLKAKNSIIASIEKQNEETGETQKQNIVEKTTETSIELKETITKAEMTIDKAILSTTAENEVNIGIELITADLNYDLFKNPTFKIQLPSAVEKVEFIGEPSILNRDGFTAISQNYDETNNIVTVNLTGTQTAYPQTEVDQPYIQVSMKITLKELATSEEDKITMKYTNELASQYAGGTTEEGVIEQDIEISAQPGLWKMFNLSSNENKSQTETIKQQITEKQMGKTLTFEQILVNNTGSNIRNVRILGKLPTTGNTITGQNENTLETKLTSIETENATIYYTENANATIDTENAENGWTTELSSLTNAKMYLIKLEQLAQGSNYTVKVNVQLPSEIEEELESYTQYEVIYDTDTKIDVKEASRKISLVTYVVTDLEVSITGTVGADTLKNGDKVKEGEVIKYTVTVRNNGRKAYENLQLKLGVPEGTTLVTPINKHTFLNGEQIEEGGYVYAQDAYYEEITESSKLEELTTISLSLGAGKSYTTVYEVRVNSNNTTGTELLNLSTIISEGIDAGSAKLKNIIEESDIRVTIKRANDIKTQLISGKIADCIVYIENLSSTTINNLQMQIISNAYKIESLESKDLLLYKEIPEKITINSVEANSIKTFTIEGLISQDVDIMDTYVIVSDLEGKKYRSNLWEETLPRVDATIEMNSSQDNQYIKEGDIVEYNITLKNTGDIKTSFEINDEIPEILEVQSVSINNQLTQQRVNKSDEETYYEKISNNVTEDITLEVKETALIKITTKVGYISELDHGKLINNTAYVNTSGVSQGASKSVTHILKASDMQDDNLDNIISGFAWLDSNENGQKDANEQNLSNITVKLYDISKQSYVSDEYGNILESITNEKGEYNFIQIYNGSYIVIFDYDISQYQPTTYMAENTDTTINSKATVKYINSNEYAGVIEINDLKENVFNMNIGLKEGETERPTEENPDQPENPGDTEQPINPETPTTPDKTEETLKTISGTAWLDSDRNGQKDSGETSIEGIRVSVYDISKNNYLRDDNGNIIETITDANGKYTFSNIEKGDYILIFEYDTDEFEPTTYMAQGANTTNNSKVVLKKININGQEILAAITDKINVQDNVNNINIGLKEKLIFDLELNKYISRIIVQTNKETKAYEYENKTFAKAEIHKKQINGALVVLEYTIKVRNNGEISGYVRNIVDYLPSGLTFSSELNTDWYLSDGNLYTKSLESVEIKPGEEKEVKLILTKAMTNENVGLINNRAEIYQEYNEYGESDIDSTPKNQEPNEDDLGTVDVIIQVATGGNNIAYTILIMINIVLIGIAIKLMIQNDIIKVPTKRERR